MKGSIVQNKRRINVLPPSTDQGPSETRHLTPLTRDHTSQKKSYPWPCLFQDCFLSLSIYLSRIAACQGSFEGCGGSDSFTGGGVARAVEGGCGLQKAVESSEGLWRIVEDCEGVVEGFWRVDECGGGVYRSVKTSLRCVHIACKALPFTWECTSVLSDLLLDTNANYWDTHYL